MEKPLRSMRRGTNREGASAWACLSVFILLIFTRSPLEGSGAGTTGGAILNMPVGARAIAMGEAYAAQADDVSSLYWNPAGIAILNQSQASFMYNASIQDQRYNHAAVALPLENGGVGAGLSYLTYGSINGYDVQGRPAGNVDAYSGVATLGGAWLGDFWSGGINVKGIQESLADVKATGFASDLGLNVLYPEETLAGTLRFGLALRNWGSGLKFLQENDPFPTEWRMGMAAVQALNGRVNLSLDWGKARGSPWAVYVGGEYWPGKWVALRTGYAGTGAEGSGLRAGLGLRIKDVSFDYAYSPYGDLGMAHRYELSYRFGAIRPLLTPEERRILRRGKTAMRQGRYGEAALLFNSLIEMEPRYRPVRRLFKTAMKGNERQEQMMIGMNTFEFHPAGGAPKRRDLDTEETAEIIKLLSVDATTLATAQPSSGAEKGPERPHAPEALP